MTLYLENEVDAKFEFDIEEICNRCIETVLNNLKCPYECEISVTITDPKGIQQLNKQFRQVDSVTDVLSFPMMEYENPADFESDVFMNSLSISPDTQELVLGDVVLCEEVIRRQAKEFGHSELREFSFLVVHSLLHLCGFDHMEEDERYQMEGMQREIMEQLNIMR